MKRILSLILAIVFAFGALVTMPVTSHATTVSMAKKTSTAVGEEGRFEVEIQVQGEDKSDCHNEVIVMVDGSYSTDDEWAATRTAILKIGKTVFENSENTLLTIMAFGIGDNIVLKHVKSTEELETDLTKDQKELLYGRRSKNCESGFTGIAEYIDSHDETLNKVSVVYITDGEINTDETKYVFYNWNENTWLNRDAAILAKWAIEEEYLAYEKNGTSLSNAYLTIFGNQAPNTFDEDRQDGEIIFDEGTLVEDENKLKQTLPEGVVSEEANFKLGDVAFLLAQSSQIEELVSDEKAMKWAELVWEEVYEYFGMNPEKAYTVSDSERAFVKYDKEKGTHVREIFYYALWGREYPEMNTRTLAAGMELADHKKVANIYMVDRDDATSWMSDLASSTSNVSFYAAGSANNLLAVLEDFVTNLTYTKYNDVIITDYMSKWVNLDRKTIKIVDNHSGATIWTNTEGWIISENKPTIQTTPVYIEEVSADVYADGGENVEGNENGTVYKLTWYVKDGPMLQNHNYSLIYEVDVDTQEPGFKYGTNYPANGNTTIKYIEKNCEETTEVIGDISVPNVIANKAKQEYIDITVTKTWVDESNKYDARPESITVNLFADGTKVAYQIVTAEDNWEYTFNDVDKYNDEGEEIVYTISEDKVADYEATVCGYDITNVYVGAKPEPETIDVSGRKTWSDENDKYNARPESITVNLLADGVKVAYQIVTDKDNWEYTFEDVEKYNSNGKRIVYTISEDKVTDYNAIVCGYDITNVYVGAKPEPNPETIDVSGRKTWIDEDDKYKARPKSITVNLFADGVKVDCKVVTAEDNWKYTFKDMKKYNSAGNKIVYTISENEVSNYETIICSYDITNIYVKPESKTETIDICGTKIWKDNNDKYGKRPESITVNLYANGRKVSYQVVTAKNNWKYSFKDFAKYNADGKEIMYVVSEKKVANYETSVSGYDITNTYVELETVDVCGTKTWKDNNDRYGKRPESITVNLLANGKRIAYKVVTEKDNWKYSFKNLPKYDEDGEKIVYTVTENSVANYKTTIKGYDIVNSYKKPIFYYGDNPSTGDYIYRSVITLVISGAALYALLYFNKKHKNRKK